uniref:Gliding motility protein SprA N-terminal domain-containing protein n=1 Tax=Sphingobacterium sp. (strain 21) TaxID=743722 RepID=F4CCF8_SPHS2
MRNTFSSILFFLFFFSVPGAIDVLARQKPALSTNRDSTKNVSDSTGVLYPIKDEPFLNLYQRDNGIHLRKPGTIKREIDFDPIGRQYIIRDNIGSSMYRPPQYLSIDEYQQYENQSLKERTWRELSDDFSRRARKDGWIPSIQVNSPTFEKIFGGNTINIIPRGSVDATIMGQYNKNDNPMFNERQRKQFGFDFDQRIQMNLTGQIGDRMRIITNYNTEAQFDFENQIKFDYVGKDDAIIRRIEVGNVSMPLNSTLISGTQALFGVKTQLQFGKLGVTSVFSQQRSQSKEITITNGAQQNEFSLKADEYEQNKHYFLAQYFRDNYNRAMSNAPLLLTNVNITQIEVWVTNRSNSIENSRDVLAFMDLGESRPWNPMFNQPGGSQLPAAGVVGDPAFPEQSNRLLQILQQQYPDARYSSSNAVAALFQSSGANDNYARLSNARKLTEKEYTVNRRLGYISLNTPLNADQVLAVAYRYTANGREYQVGEFSTDIPITPSNPQVLFTKLLKNEVLKPNLPVWDLMMKNIYSIGAYRVGRNNFILNVFRLEDETGVERPVMFEGKNTTNKLWLQLTGLDRLNPQNDRQPDGVFDFLEGLTIDPEYGRVVFPVVEPFGKDLKSLFAPGEEQLAERYAFQELYDSTKVVAQQLFANKNRYAIRGTYESEAGSEFQLGAINIPRGSVQVYAGGIPLQEGADFTVDYEIGRVRILNEALLRSGQAIRIKMENNELFGLQQRTLFGSRLDYMVNDQLQLGGTIMNLSERPLTQKVNLAQEPISNTIWGFDVNYNAPSRWLTRMVDKIPFINTREESTISFYSEFANLIPGHSKATNIAGSRNGASYIDDFENSRSIIDLKGAYSWQISGTPQLFPESQLSNDLRYGYNRARLAFYNIDPVFYRNDNSLTPANIRGNLTELSNHYVREVLEQEVFPNKQTVTGQPLFMSTLDLSFYPTIRGPYNYTLSGVNSDGTLTNPKSRWGGMFRQIQTPDFEAQNIEFIELWMMDPFIYKPQDEGGDLYFNLGNISEDILKDGRRAVENALPTNGNYAEMDLTNWGRVPKLQPMVQAFANNPDQRALQDVGLDALNDADERNHFSNFLSQASATLNPQPLQELNNDPSSDNFSYFRSAELDAQNAGILKRYERFNGTEGNSKTAEQAGAGDGVNTSASTLLPDGEDVNRDNTMNQIDEYYQYRVSVRPQDMMVGKNFIVDMIDAPVTLANGKKENVKWYQLRIPITQYESKAGDPQDFKSIRFIRMFMTNFADTSILRMARLQLVRGEWRRFNSERSPTKVIADPTLNNPGLDNSTIEVAAVSIEENGNRQPIPYVVPPGIERQIDYGNYNTNVQLNEQALSVTVNRLRDGYGQAAYRTSTNDFRAYKRLQMFVHAEGDELRSGDLHGFIRVGTDGIENYYEYEMPLEVTTPGSRDPDAIWPSSNRMNVEIKLFQEAKEARNKATLPDGSPWPINLPYSFVDGTNTVTIKGQPDISKIRFYMLGVKNPLKGQNNANDDGMEKSGVIWFNELRLTDYEDKGGWAATARLNAKLADFADVTVSGSKSTIGFGAIDARINERNRTEDRFFDFTSSVELGKFFPERTGIRIPFYFNYSSQVRTPQYNPLMPDIEMKSALDGLNDNQKDSLLRLTQDYTTRKSISFMNVRKLRMDNEKPVRLWDIENFSVSYAFSQFYHRDYLTEKSVQNNYRASLSYDYVQNKDKYIEPLKKLFKGRYTRLLSDLNFNLMPSFINFRIDVQRLYTENTLRTGSSPDNYLPAGNIGTLYNKNFTMTRLYGISWNLTRSLKLDFNATNYSIIDEPQGRLDGLKRDTLWENFWKLGRTTDYNHMMNLTYNVPLDKIPGLDWINVAARYGSQFAWQTQPLLAINDPNLNIGNTIQNSRTLQLNPRFNLLGLFNKFPFFRDARNGRSPNKGTEILANFVSGIKDINAAYTRVDGTFLPGYLGKTNMLGLDFDMNAPGFGFIFGGQGDILGKAIANGWLSTDSLQTQLYAKSLREDLSIRATLEPFKDLRIDLTATRIENRNFTTQVLFNEDTQGFERVTPVTAGDYSISYLSLKTAFSNKDELFRTFERNRGTISRRLGQLNPNSEGTIGDFADGYGNTAQDVVVGAFLAAYTGKSPEKQSLGVFPRIPIPNWRIMYNGLAKYPFFSEYLSSLELVHGYRTLYNINGYTTLIRYGETNGASSVRDVNGNFLPQYQFSQITLQEQFLPLIGFNARFKNNLTANAEYRKARTLSLSLQNSQLAQLLDEGFILGAGYRVANFRFPFGWFADRKVSNDLTFKLDVAINDMKTLVYRSDSEFSEMASGNKNITYRPSIDYMFNNRFNIRMFFDSNAVKPYTSQTYATAYSNFGFNLRILLQ